MLPNGLPVPADIFATRLAAALPARQIVGGIDGLTVWASVHRRHFLKPLFVADRFDPRLRVPKFLPMRRGRLKSLQLLTGIFRTRPAKVKSFFRGAREHFTNLTIRAALVGTAARIGASSRSPYEMI